MRRSPWRAALLSVALAGPAVAQDARQLEVDAANASVKLAYAHFKAGQFDKALTDFERAEPLGDALGDRATLKYMIGRCHEELQHPLDAARLFDRAIELERDPERVQKYRGQLQRLEARSFGQIAVTCEPSRSTVRLGEGEPTACPAEFVRLPPGPTDLELLRDDGPGAAERIVVAAGHRSSVTLRARASLTVNAGGLNGAVWIDGKAMGWLPIAPLELAPGAHRVEIRSNERTLWSQTSELAPGERRTLTAETSVRAETVAPEAQPGSDALPWALAFSGGAALTAAGVFWVLGAGEYAEARDAKSRYDAATSTTDAARARREARDHAAEGDLDRWLTFGMLGAGAALGGVATWLFLVTPDSNDIDVNAGPGRAEVIWRAHF
jgi:tetratricopeptide (TPR) repeat protein